ncbi:MAG: polysaccharide biosynthesis tyrosine autokinase, partial [Pyrinomonadaceae bacterium]|nr:polysaccharide biosynthesis tyrosine autokinase [Pyrinomonadaceae bacterium]
VRRLAPYVGMLRGGLDVRAVKGRSGETRLIEVALQHRDPQVATRIVNTIVKIFARLNQERRRESGATTGEFIQRRIAELQAQIRADKQRLIDYGKRHQFIALEPGQDTVLARLVGLNNELLTAENDLKLAEAEKEASLAPEVVEVTALGASAGLEGRRNDLLQKRAELLVENTEEWPPVKELDGQIAELDKQIKIIRERAGTTLTTNLTKRYRQAKEREQKLRASYEQQRRETIVQNEAAINYHIIEQEIGTNEGLLKDLYLRMGENEAKLAGIGQMPNNISVLDYAQVPGQPIGPKRMQNVALAFVLSLGAGIGFAIFLSFLDHSIHSIDEVERKLHLPALGAIPLIGSSTRRHLLPGVGALQRRNGNGNGHGRPLLVNDDVRSPVAEAYRHLRTSVLMSVAGRAPKTLLVTSSQPSEGKTTTVVNMAMVLAQTGASVLVIDADMRRPSLHSIFNLENDRGLSTYLSSGMSDAEAFSMIEQTGESNLYVLTSGPPPPNPAELLGSEPMHRLIKSVESAYTHIIIDSPPVAYFTDSVLVSLLVDGVLLVVNSGSTSREIVRHSRKVLQDVGAKIFGVVLNGVKEDSTHEYYYSRGYY